MGQDLIPDASALLGLPFCLNLSGIMAMPNWFPIDPAPSRVGLMDLLRLGHAYDHGCSMNFRTN